MATVYIVEIINYEEAVNQHLQHVAKYSGKEYRAGTLRAVWHFLQGISGTVNINGLSVIEFEHFDALREAYDLDPSQFQPDDLEAIVEHLQAERCFDKDDYMLRIFHHLTLDYYAVINLEKWAINGAIVMNL